MPWADLALLACWLTALTIACRYWRKTFRRDDHSNQQMIVHLRTKYPTEQEAGNQ